MEQHESHLEAAITGDLNAVKPVREGLYQFRELVHDDLIFGGGTSWFETLAWWFVGKCIS